jgi:hypothetical protein
MGLGPWGGLYEYDIQLAAPTKLKGGGSRIAGGSASARALFRGTTIFSGGKGGGGGGLGFFFRDTVLVL